MKMKLRMLAISFGFTVSLVGCLPGVPIDLITHGAQPDIEPTPQIFLDLCAKDAGAFVYRNVPGQRGYLKMPDVFVGMDGSEKPLSSYSSFRSEFSTKPPRKLFSSPVPMTWNPSDTSLHYYEGYNPPYQDLAPIMGPGDGPSGRLPDPNLYFEGYVRKEVVRRPSPKCEEHDSVIPSLGSSTSTHCIYYGKSNEPYSEFARQRIIRQVARVPIENSSSFSNISSRTFKIYNTRTGEVLAEQRRYYHSFSYTASAFWKGELYDRSTVRLASCSSAIPDDGRGKLPDNWHTANIQHVLGIKPE